MRQLRRINAKRLPLDMRSSQQISLGFQFLHLEAQRFRCGFEAVERDFLDAALWLFWP